MPDHGSWCFKQPRDGGTISGRQSVQVKGAHSGHIVIDDVQCHGSAPACHDFAPSCSATQPAFISDTEQAGVKTVTGKAYPVMSKERKAGNS